MQNEFASSFAAKAGSRCSGNEGFDFALPMEREHPVVQLHFVYFVMVGAGLDEMREAEFWAFSANFSLEWQAARVAPELGKALRLCVGFSKGSTDFLTFSSVWRVSDLGVFIN